MVSFSLKIKTNAVATIKRLIPVFQLDVYYNLLDNRDAAVSLWPESDKRGYSGSIESHMSNLMESIKLF